MRGFVHESAHNESKEWYTPRPIFEALGRQFDLDPCSPGQGVVPWIPAKTHLTIRENGLTAPWAGRVFLNPPYGMDTPKWLRRLVEHSNGIALVFARTDTKWFHDYVSKANAICFIRGRVAFVPAKYASEYEEGLYAPKGSCGAPSMLVAYGKDNAKAVMRCGLGLALSVRA